MASLAVPKGRRTNYNQYLNSQKLYQFNNEPLPQFNQFKKGAYLLHAFAGLLYSLVFTTGTV